MKNSTRKLIIILTFIVIGIQFAYITFASPTKDHKDHNPELPISVEALIPRHAKIIWHSVIYLGPDNEEDIAVLYSTPLLFGNDSIKYLELFSVNDRGPAMPQDRIYLGGRGMYGIDKVSVKDKTITVHAREHQHNDPISTPSKHVNIIIKSGPGAITVSTQYPPKS